MLIVRNPTCSFPGRQGGIMSTKNYARGGNIVKRRKQLGMSQSEVAEIIGIGRQALSAIENGGDFKVSVLENLAIALKISTDELLFDTIKDNKNVMISEIIGTLKNMDECEIKKWLRMLRAVYKNER